MVAATTGGALNSTARRWLVWSSTATAVLPIVVAVLRARADGWVATSDNAFIAIRGLDVLGLDHHPLSGTWSSVSTSADAIVHHPGPLLFDVLAVPSWLLGTDVGVPVAVGCLNAGCAWWMVSLVGYLGGLAARLLAAIVVALLAWTMTWPLLIEPWNPHAAMIPALLFVVACGALTLGEPRAALPAVVAGSLCLQVHLGYVYIVGLTVLATFGLWVLSRRWRVGDIQPWSRRQWLLPLVVLLALWLQPLIDLLVNGGDSNLAAMLQNAGGLSGEIGPSLALQLVAAVIAVPPWWLPNGFDGPTVFDPPPAVLTSVVALTVLVALLAIVAWRGPTRLVRSYALYVALLLPLAVVSVARIPLNEVVGFSRHQWRWLWVVGALTTLVLGWAVIALVQRSLVREWVPVTTAVAAAACISVIGLNVIAEARTRPIEQQQQAAIDELVDRLPFDELAQCGQVVVDYEGGFAPPALVAPSVLLALREHDIEFAPTAADGMVQVDRRPRAEGACRVTLAEEPGDGRLVGALDAPLAVFVTFRSAET